MALNSLAVSALLFGFPVTIGINTVAVIKNSEQSLKIFYVHSRDLHGMSHSFRK